MTSDLPYVHVTEQGIRFSAHPPSTEDIVGFVLLNLLMRYPEMRRTALTEHYAGADGWTCPRCSEAYEAPIAWPCETWEIAERARIWAGLEALTRHRLLGPTGYRAGRRS